VAPPPVPGRIARSRNIPADLPPHRARAIPGDGSVGRTDQNTRQFDRKLDVILRQAAAVFCAKGFDRASIRDIARETGVSLAGLYYYFSSKEELLYKIQRHTFETMLASSRAALVGLDTAEERLRIFIRLHLQYFIEHPNEMKVLTHEVGPLEQTLRRELSALKKSYYQLCFDQVDALRQEHRLNGVNTRLAALSLFGMMNWIYQWYKPRFDPDARACAEQMTSTFLYGILGRWARRGPAIPGAGAVLNGSSSGRNSQGNGFGAHEINEVMKVKPNGSAKRKVR
jgi:AcrR family transcriptional regulator